MHWLKISMQLGVSVHSYRLFRGRFIIVQSDSSLATRDLVVCVGCDHRPCSDVYLHCRKQTDLCVKCLVYCGHIIWLFYNVIKTIRSQAMVRGNSVNGSIPQSGHVRLWLPSPRSRLNEQQLLWRWVSTTEDCMGQAQGCERVTCSSCSRRRQLQHLAIVMSFKAS